MQQEKEITTLLLFNGKIIRESLWLSKQIYICLKKKSKSIYHKNVIFR